MSHEVKTTLIYKSSGTSFWFHSSSVQGVENNNSNANNINNNNNNNNNDNDNDNNNNNNNTNSKNKNKNKNNNKNKNKNNTTNNNSNSNSNNNNNNNNNNSHWRSHFKRHTEIHVLRLMKDLRLKTRSVLKSCTVCKNLSYHCVLWNQISCPTSVLHGASLLSLKLHNKSTMHRQRWIWVGCTTTFFWRKRHGVRRNVNFRESCCGNLARLLC